MTAVSARDALAEILPRLHDEGWTLDNPDLPRQLAAEFAGVLAAEAARALNDSEARAEAWEVRSHHAGSALARVKALADKMAARPSSQVSYWANELHAIVDAEQLHDRGAGSR